MISWCLICMLYIMMTTLMILLFDDDRWVDIPTCDSSMWFGLLWLSFPSFFGRKNLISWDPHINQQQRNKGRVALPKRMSFRKSSKGRGAGVVIFNPKIYIVDFVPIQGFKHEYFFKGTFLNFLSLPCLKIWHRLNIMMTLQNQLSSESNKLPLQNSAPKPLVYYTADNWYLANDWKARVFNLFCK